MRVYFVQLRNSEGVWITGEKKYLSNRKAHSAARRQRLPARVLQVLEKQTIPAGTR